MLQLDLLFWEEWKVIDSDGLPYEEYEIGV